MARLTAQEKRDREFMALLDNALLDQKVELGVLHAREKSAARNEGFERGWGQGYKRAVEEFAQLSWLDRLFWRAER